MNFSKFSPKLQLFLIAIVTVTMFLQPPAANAGRTTDRALQILSRSLPISNMDDKQLNYQLKALDKFLEKKRVNKKTRKAAKRRLRSIRAEIQKRQGAVAPVAPTVQNFPVLRDRRPANRLSKQQLRGRISVLRNVLKSANISTTSRSRARNMLSRDIAELKNRRRQTQQANNPPVVPQAGVLSDHRRAKSLSKTQLRKRIGALRGFIATPGVQGKLLRQARRQLVKDIVELEKRRNAVVTVAPQPEPARIDVLQDRRPAVRLTQRELRRRVNALRDQLRKPNHPRKIRKQLSRKLVSDRAELRRRVAARRNAGANRQPQLAGNARASLGQQARSLLSDGRRSRSLNKRQLRHRISSAREVLKYVALSSSQQLSMRSMLAADRQEKRNRLLAAKDRRRAKIARMKARGQLKIQIVPDYAPRQSRQYGDIAAAEADDEAIQRQFLRRKKRTYSRRYSRAELSRRPELTRQFAGIDVDTINFGFNEYWIREEEVDELESMAITIERILAARPYEVFQIEGHTDAVGSDAYNLGLSRQRAEAVKNALTKFFVIPPHSLVTVGLGKRYLKIPTPDPEAENRRVTVRRITDIVR